MRRSAPARRGCWRGSSEARTRSTGSTPTRRRATIDALTGLDPEPWTAAWGGLADDFAARAEAATDPATERDLWVQAYRAAFMGRYPVPNHPLKERQYERARDFFLKATALEKPAA